MHYKISLPDPNQHLFHIELNIGNALPSQIIRLPSWIPGSYMIRDFSKNIVSIDALDQNGAVVALNKLDKQTWQANIESGQLVIRYQVYAFDMSVRTAYLDNDYGFFNGTSLCLSADGQEQQPCNVEIIKPTNTLFANWTMHTGLEPKQINPDGFGHYQADNYQQLIDTPVTMGNLRLLSFDVAGVPHKFVISGEQDFDQTRLVKDLTAICQTQIDFFGGTAPFDQYVFMLKLGKNDFGGLEHHNSTALICSHENLPALNEPSEISDNYQTLLSLCCHEYLHNWNIKRIKPKQFLPYQLDQETYTTQLWIYEGFTSYYDDMLLVRSGIITPTRYLKILSKVLTRYLSGQGRHLQTVTDSSFDAWTRFYQQTENAPNAIVSYYVKGAVIALCLDIHMQSITNNEYRLDDVLKQMWHQHGAKSIGTDEHDVEAMITNLVPELQSFLDSVLYTTEDIDIAAVLELVGASYHERPATSMKSTFGTVENEESTEQKTTPTIGARFSDHNGMVKLATVFKGGSAEGAGLCAGDLIIAIDKLQVSTTDIESTLARRATEQHIEVTYFRRGELKQTTMTLKPTPYSLIALSIENAKAVNQWLGV